MTADAIFYFDLTSPYSYLCATQLGSIAQRTRSSFSWRPIVLGAVFNELGIRVPASIPAKAEYMFEDLKRWAKYYDVPLLMPTTFPFNSMKAHRAIVAAQALVNQEVGQRMAHAAFRAAWVQGKDLTEDDVIVELADEHGADGATILQATQDPKIKDLLRKNTEEAIESGCFGAPSIVIDEELFWGNDRLQFVEAALMSR